MWNQSSVLQHCEGWMGLSWMTSAQAEVMGQAVWTIGRKLALEAHSDPTQHARACTGAPSAAAVAQQTSWMSGKTHPNEKHIVAAALSFLVLVINLLAKHVS